VAFVTKPTDDDAPRVVRARLASGNVYIALRSANRLHRIANKLAWAAVLFATAIILVVFLDGPF
jgi:hypothetical protein